MKKIISILDETTDITDIGLFDKISNSTSARRFLVIKGGPGSGDFEHHGRPGKVGGSSKGNEHPKGNGKNTETTIGSGISGEDIKYTISDAPELPYKNVPMFGSRQEVKAAFGNAEIAYNKKLTEDERNAILEYTGDLGVDINTMLRENSVTDPEYKEKMKLLDSAIDKASFPKSAYAIRYMMVYKDTDLKSLRGKTIQDHAYISTSLENRKYEAIVKDAMDNAMEYSDPGDWVAVKMSIVIPRGSKAALLQGTGTDYSASEVLLPRNAKLHVRNVYDVTNEDYKVGGYPTVAMELVYGD